MSGDTSEVCDLMPKLEQAIRAVSVKTFEAVGEMEDAAGKITETTVKLMETMATTTMSLREAADIAFENQKKFEELCMRIDEEMDQLGKLEENL